MNLVLDNVFMPVEYYTEATLCVSFSSSYTSEYKATHDVFELSNS